MHLWKSWLISKEASLPDLKNPGSGKCMTGVKQSIYHSLLRVFSKCLKNLHELQTLLFNSMILLAAQLCKCTEGFSTCTQDESSQCYGKWIERNVLWAFFVFVFWHTHTRKEGKVPVYQNVEINNNCSHRIAQNDPECNCHLLTVILSVQQHKWSADC